MLRYWVFSVLVFLCCAVVFSDYLLCFGRCSAVAFSDYLVFFFVFLPFLLLCFLIICCAFLLYFLIVLFFCFFPAVFLILLFLCFCFVNVFFVLPHHSVNLICCVYTLNLLISQNIIRSRGEETTGQRRL